MTIEGKYEAICDKCQARQKINNQHDTPHNWARVVFQHTVRHGVGNHELHYCPKCLYDVVKVLPRPKEDWEKDLED